MDLVTCIAETSKRPGILVAIRKQFAEPIIMITTKLDVTVSFAIVTILELHLAIAPT